MESWALISADLIASGVIFLIARPAAPRRLHMCQGAARCSGGGGYRPRGLLRPDPHDSNSLHTLFSTHFHTGSFFTCITRDKPGALGGPLLLLRSVPGRPPRHHHSLVASPAELSATSPGPQLFGTAMFGFGFRMQARPGVGLDNLLGLLEDDKGPLARWRLSPSGEKAAMRDSGWVDVCAPPPGIVAWFRGGPV